MVKPMMKVKESVSIPKIAMGRSKEGCLHNYCAVVFFSGAPVLHHSVASP